MIIEYFHGFNNVEVVNDLQRHVGGRNQAIMVENTEEGMSIVLRGR